MNNKKISTAILAIALCASMATPVYAATNPFAQMEAQSRQAVESAIKAKTVPAGTTIYDCMYGADKNGVTIVIQYKDKSGNWIDVVTQKQVDNKSESTAGTANKTIEKVSDGTLAEYTAEVLRLVNQEREKVGLEPLERDNLLDEAANTRALDCSSVNSLYIDGKAHIRPDGSRWFAVLGIDKNYNYGENVGQGGATADIRMKSWMKSEGHKANILRDDYTEIGIGCVVSEQGEIFAVQIFYRP